MSATFAQATLAQETRTTNGMATFASSLNKNVDLFYKIGASRGQNIIGAFTAAYVENADIALRIAQWTRDVRGGAGERELFRQVLTHLENSDPVVARKLVMQIPEIGRWDDLLVLQTPALKTLAFSLIETALLAGNGLCAKWMPRKGKIAEELRAHLGFTPKRYRKTLVTLTNVVETQMCAKEWDNIEFGKIPSLAAARYRKAFKRNAEESYTKYAEGLANGTEKINAAAVFPYDVLKGNYRGSYGLDATEQKVIIAQWDSLPNYIGDAAVLPMVDVSGSMDCAVGSVQGAKAPAVTCLQVAVSLGLYCASKNTGAFKDTFLSFSTDPVLEVLTGNILQKIDQMNRSNWAMSTDLHKAFDVVLRTALKGNVAAADMPKYILIFSDMQFNQCARFDDNAIGMIRRKYEAAGYEMPKVVFWNLRDAGGVPARADDDGVALVSGFSPALMKSILAGKQFNPTQIMLDTVMIDRYTLA